LMVGCSPRLCGHSRAERDDRDHAADNFFQGGSPKQATPLPRQTSLSTRNRFTPNFQGWGLDENLKPKSPPYRGAHIDVRWQDKNEVGLAARRLHPALRSRCAPCSHSSLYDCAKKAYNLYSRNAQARFIRTKSASRKRTPSIVNLTVKRRYLTEHEVERLMD